MSQKNNKKTNAGQKGSTRNLFQFIAAVVIVLVVSYFFYTSVFKSSSTVKRENNLKDYTAFQFKKEGELTFTTSAQEFISKIDIEIAEDDDSRTQGLMYRNKMQEDRGMFFIFPREAYQSFWMRNTVIPLDIVFVNKQNEIVKIHKNTEPFYEGSYPSDGLAIYVVEVNAGYTDAHGIKEGDKIVWRRI